MIVRFLVPGVPQGKGRARATAINGRARMFTPAKTVAYESLIGMAAMDAIDGLPPLEGAVRLSVRATFPIPASWSNKRKDDARWHTGKPDADNIVKAVGDGCNGILWGDDSRVALIAVEKVYGPEVGLQIEVEALT